MHIFMRKEVSQTLNIVDIHTTVTYEYKLQVLMNILSSQLIISFNYSPSINFRVYTTFFNDQFSVGFDSISGKLRRFFAAAFNSRLIQRL